MKTKVVVVDDDYSALRAIKNYCEQLDLNVIEAFDSPTKFVDAIDTLNFDLAILDYSMPQYNGIQLAEILNSKNIPVIFVTGHRDEIAAKAWDLNCIACIEKPVNIEKIKSSLSKFSIPRIKNDDSISLLTYGGLTTKIKHSDIAYITTCPDDKSHNDKDLFTLSGKKHRVVNKKLEELINVLPHSEFMRIGKSDIVSKAAIEKHSKNFDELHLVITDSKNKPVTLYVSDQVKDKFKTWYE